MEGQSTSAPDLPWTGAALADKVSILLKTNEEEDPASMANFIHQAVVRRDVVISLIEGAKLRGHRGYKDIDMARVRIKAQALPEHAVPPEIVRLLPHDNDLDKVQVQKQATPAPGRYDLDGVGKSLDTTRPNAVVQEKSSYDESDINAQRIAALCNVVEKLGLTAPRT
eukprot:2103701-Heterocapsa_arctica.AAC.1